MDATKQLWDIQVELSPLRNEKEVKEARAKAEAAKADAAAAAAAGGADDSGKKKFKWSTSVDSAFQFDHKAAHPCADLSAVEWSEANLTGVERSDKGSEGLFFVETKNDGALVIKRSKAIGSELFCTLLALRLGIASPKMRIIDTNSEEGVKMLTAMKKKDPTYRVRSTLFEQHFLLALEYLPSVNCNDLDYVRARDLFGPELAADASESGKQRLREIGAMLALDVLVNNCDRLPLIWAHRGNPGNIIFARDHSQCFSIDGQIIAIDRLAHQDQYDQYMDRVDKLLAGMAKGSASAAPEFAVVRDKFKEWFEYDIGDHGCLELQRGFQGIVDQAKQEQSAAKLKADLDQWVQLLSRYEPTLSDLPQIRPSFVADVWNRFAQS